MEPTDAEILEDLMLAGIEWGMIGEPPAPWTLQQKSKRIEYLRIRARPQYAGVLKKLQEGNGGQDYKVLMHTHICHHAALGLIKVGQNGKLAVMSASAGEVSVSYGGGGGGGIKTTDNWDLTEWGQENKRLRKANGAFAAVGNGPPIRFR